MQTELERLKRERYELTITLDRCIRAKNIALMYEIKSKIRIVNEMIEDIERVDAIKLDDVNNKHLKSWFGKSLSLSINCYDMGTYYLDSTVNFLKEKGMQPKDRFAEVVNNANKAINELRKEIAKFLVDYQDDNWEDFEQLEKMLSDKIFTDRELVYKRKYEK